MPSPRTRLGDWGERHAEAHLAAQGMRVLDRNFRTRYGEVDLVARDGEEIVFVEVRTRRSRSYGTPEESVTAAKRRRLALAAQQYLQERGLDGQPWRVDLVAVHLSGDTPSVNHLRGIEVEEPS